MRERKGGRESERFYFVKNLERESRERKLADKNRRKTLNGEYIYSLVGREIERRCKHFGSDPGRPICLGRYADR